MSDLLKHVNMAMEHLELVRSMLKQQLADRRVDATSIQPQVIKDLKESREEFISPDSKIKDDWWLTYRGAQNLVDRGVGIFERMRLYASGELKPKKSTGRTQESVTIFQTRFKLEELKRLNLIPAQQKLDGSSVIYYKAGDLRKLLKHAKEMNDRPRPRRRRNRRPRMQVVSII